MCLRSPCVSAAGDLAPLIPPRRALACPELPPADAEGLSKRERLPPRYRGARSLS